MAEQDPRVFVVRRVIPSEVRDASTPEAKSQYLAVFPTREAADAHAQHLDRGEKRTAPSEVENPFWERSLAELTTMPEFAFRDWLQEAEIPLPAPKHGWDGWWDNSMYPDSKLTLEQRARVWEALNLYVFYEVIELPSDKPLRRKGYAVVYEHWEYNDEGYDGSNDGIRVYSTKAAAEAECRRLQAEGMQDEDDDDDYYGGQFVVVELELNPTPE